MLLSNETLEEIQKSAEAIQNDPNVSLKEKDAAFQLVRGCLALIVAQMERHLIETGHGEEVKKINAKAKSL